MIQIFAYGRLGKAPDRRVTASQKDMAITSMACDATPGNADEQETIWLQVLAFGRQAEVLGKHEQGDLMGVQGRLTQSRYTSRDGEARTSWTVIAEQITSSRTVRPGGGKKRKEKQEKTAADFNDEIQF